MAAMFPMSSVAFTHTEEDFDSDSGDFDTEEVDEEVDELVSSGPEETNIPAVKRPKKPPKKIAQPGRVVVPIDRIQSVIEADGMYLSSSFSCCPHIRAGGLAGFALSKEALFVLSAATVCKLQLHTVHHLTDSHQEAFIKRLSQVAQQTTQTQGRYTVNYQDMGIYFLRVTNVSSSHFFPSLCNRTIPRIHVFARYIQIQVYLFDGD